jgi:hypothetical protein
MRREPTGVIVTSNRPATGHEILFTMPQKKVVARKVMIYTPLNCE